MVWEDVSQGKDQWEILSSESVERQSQFKTDSDIKIQKLYTPLEVKSDTYMDQLNFPGSYPFTRGIHPTMYRGRFWTMRQYAGFGSAEETNRRFKYLLEQGQTGLSVAFDLPTQMGYNSDHPLARGEVGKVGVAIDSLSDMEVLLRDIPLNSVSTSMTINATAAILLAMYIAAAEKQGIKANKLSGTIQNDILKEYFARGTYIFPPHQSLRLITDTFKYCAEQVPNWNTISISGYHIREAGANAVQEVAFTFSNGIEYVQSAINAGLEIDQVAPRLSFFFGAHSNFFEEIAKFRAARRIWAKIMKEKFKARNPKSMMLRFHTQTAGSTLTAQQPEVNIVRVAFQALSAVLGGTQSLHTNAWDEALALPTEESALLALRTQQVIAYETGAADLIDPLGGSYYLEKLTDELEQKMWDYINKIDQMGGSIAAIERGYQQKEISASAYRHQLEVENQQKTIIGVNKFMAQRNKKYNLLKINQQIEEEQKTKLLNLYHNRDNQAVKNTLNDLKTAAQSSQNVFPYILNSVKAYAALGEIADVLRGVFGEYYQNKAF